MAVFSLNWLPKVTWHEFSLLCSDLRLVKKCFRELLWPMSATHPFFQSEALCLCALFWTSGFTFLFLQSSCFGKMWIFNWVFSFCFSFYHSSNWENDENHSYSIVMSDLINIWRPHTWIPTHTQAERSLTEFEKRFSKSQDTKTWKNSRDQNAKKY